MSKRFLMCQPDYFDIEYEINPWMDQDNQVSPDLAKEQWRKLRDIYKKLDFGIELIKPIKNLPDMVFTANGGLMVDGKFMLPRFRYQQRQPETEQFRLWAEKNADQLGIKEIREPKHDFEGEGDALVCGDLILAGHGFRSDKRAHAELDEFFDKTVIGLQLVNPNFYHLDTCLTVIDDSTVAYFPEAFDENSRAEIEQAIPRTIKANAEDAKAFGLNAVSDGHNIVMSMGALNLMHEYEKLGFHVWPTPMSEFRKSGGGVKCLTLELR